MEPWSLTLGGVDLERLDLLAQRLVGRLPAGLVFGLVGTLGAGKTRFTQALAEALGIARADVTSPTFTLLQSYPVSPVEGSQGPSRRVRSLHHLDAYRLNDEDEFWELGVEELFAASDAWTLIEWADRVESCLPDDTVWIRFRLETAGTRSLEFSSRDPTLRRPFQEIEASLPPVE